MQGSGLIVKRIGKTSASAPWCGASAWKCGAASPVGLLGPNGAGKTTTFYMIMGLIPVDYGTIELDGVDVTAMPMYRRARLGLGYLPQGASIFRGLTVEGNVMAVAELSERSGPRRQLTQELLAEFGVEHLARTPAIALSGGERRRVESPGRWRAPPATSCSTRPFAGIDPIAVGEIRSLVTHLRIAASAC